MRDRDVGALPTRGGTLWGCPVARLAKPRDLPRRSRRWPTWTGPRLDLALDDKIVVVVGAGIPGFLGLEGCRLALRPELALRLNSCLASQGLVECLVLLVLIQVL
jgi:hypothetical protein